MTQLKLHNYFRSSTSYRVRIALELKQLSYVYVPVHLTNNGGEQNSTQYRALNPMGGVPTLEHNGKLISQSLAIIEYIDEVFKTGMSLLPEDTFMKAKVRQACEIINADTHPLINLKVMQTLEKNYLFSTDQKQAWISKWTREGLLAFENTIKPYAGNFCFGDRPSAADTFLIPHLFSAKRFQVDTSDMHLLNLINDNCLQLEPFKKAHPARQPDTPQDQK